MPATRNLLATRPRFLGPAAPGTFTPAEFNVLRDALQHMHGQLAQGRTGVKFRNIDNRRVSIHATMQGALGLLSPRYQPAHSIGTTALAVNINRATTAYSQLGFDEHATALRGAVASAVARHTASCDLRPNHSHNPPALWMNIGWQLREHPAARFCLHTLSPSEGRAVFHGENIAERMLTARGDFSGFPAPVNADLFGPDAHMIDTLISARGGIFASLRATTPAFPWPSMTQVRMHASMNGPFTLRVVPARNEQYEGQASLEQLANERVALWSQGLAVYLYCLDRITPQDSAQWLNSALHARRRIEPARRNLEQLMYRIGPIFNHPEAATLSFTDNLDLRFTRMAGPRWNRRPTHTITPGIPLGQHYSTVIALRDHLQHVPDWLQEMHALAV